MSFRYCIIAALLCCGASVNCLAQAEPVTYGMSEVDVPPKPVTMSQPDRDATIKNEIGTVQLRLLIAPDGSVASCTVDSSTNPKLDQVAIETASKWKFEPAVKAGQPVAVVAKLPMRFK